MSDNNNNRNFFLLMGGLGVAFFTLCIVAVISRPAPKTIEQVRAERHESFHEAGKSVNEFLRGVVGVDSKVKKEDVQPPEEPAK